MRKNAFSNRKTDLDILSKCRNIMSNKSSTDDDWLELWELLGQLKIHGPSDLQPSIDAMMMEANTRDFYRKTGFFSLSER